MGLRLAFLLGWIGSYLSHRPVFDPEVLRGETELLRLEIRAARTAVEELESGRASCEWINWVQRWFLKLNGLFDLILLGYLVYSWVVKRSISRPVIRLPLADTGGSSTDSEDCEDLPDSRKAFSAIGKGVVSRGRPTRPSDLKGGGK